MRLDAPYHEFAVLPNRRYRFRLINAGGLSCPQELHIEGHRMRVIASDADPVEAVTVDSLISFSGK